MEVDVISNQEGIMMILSTMILSDPSRPFRETDDNRVVIQDMDGYEEVFWPGKAAR